MAGIQNINFFPFYPPGTPYRFPSPPQVPPFSPKVAPPHQPNTPPPRMGPPSPPIKPPPPPQKVAPPHPKPPPPPAPRQPSPLIPPPSPVVKPPPPPHTLPPPPPAVKPPPHPYIPPPPPAVKPPPHPYIPPPPPGHHSHVIIIFVSLGGLFFLAFLSVALCCFIKKRKKRMFKERDVVKLDEHIKVHEAIIPGPHGTQTTFLTIDEDLHIDEEIRKHEKVGHSSIMKGVEKHHQTTAMDQAGSPSGSNYKPYAS